MSTQALFSAMHAQEATDEVSSEIVALIERIKPGIVQVRNGRRGAGAGSIWRADGSILTNYHVVAGNPRGIQVLLADGRALDARVVEHNAALDLALLSVAASDLPAVPVGDSTRLRVGELVFAVGHPWGQPWVVTAGIVSGLGEIPVRGSNQSAQYIRSDVRLLPGNSGGPLLNAQGAVVGINAMVFGGDLSVAIPSHVASNWVAGPPGRPVYLGVTVQPIELPAGSQNGHRQQATGLMVVSIQPGGPAERARLMVGDVLLEVDGTPVDTADALVGVLAHRVNGGVIYLNILRGGITKAISAAVGTAEPVQ